MSAEAGIPAVLTQGQGGAVLLGSDFAPVPEARSEEERLTLLFDGRLHDRGALAADLRAAGQAPRGDGDAALVLAGWQAWGTGLLPRLRGAFALVVHDAAAGTLTCARDRFGQQPFFWSQAGGNFVFASEIQALLAWPGQGRQADLEVVSHILSFGHSPVDRTPLRGVNRLAPGHVLTLRVDGRVELAAWWQLPEVSPELSNDAAGTDALAAEYRRRLRSAVARACGGDGAAAVIGHGHAAALVDAGGRPPRPVPALDAAGASSGLPDLLSRLQLHAGEPLLAPPAMLLPMAAGLAAGRRLLSDLGADAILLDSPRYVEFGHEITRMRSDGRPPAWWAPAFHEVPPFARDLFHRTTGVLTEAERMDLSGPALAHTLLFAMPDALGTSLEDAGPETWLDRAARIDLTYRIPGLELPLLDAAATITGASVACPFLDEEVAGWCLTLPQTMRQGGLGGPVVCPITPEGEEEDWLLPNITALRPWIADTMLGSASAGRGLFRRRRVEILLAPHGSPREARELWAMLCIESWFQSFVDRMPAEPPVQVGAPVPEARESLLVAVA
jgi:asparagine synthase (glutamine-hydrolysing)